MIHRGPVFLAVVWFGSFLTPFPLFRQQVVSLSQSSCPAYLRESGGRGGAESYDGENARSSINHSMLSGWHARRHAEVIGYVLC
jgi:hypothetical protein